MSTNITTDETGQPTNKPQPKVVAAATGAGVGGAISTIGVYLIETLGGVDLPTAVEGATLILVTAGVAYLAGWIKRPSGIN